MFSVTATRQLTRVAAASAAGVAAVRFICTCNDEYLCCNLPRMSHKFLFLPLFHYPGLPIQGHQQ